MTTRTEPHRLGAAVSYRPLSERTIGRTWKLLRPLVLIHTLVIFQVMKESNKNPHYLLHYLFCPNGVVNVYRAGRPLSRACCAVAPRATDPLPGRRRPAYRWIPSKSLACHIGNQIAGWFLGPAVRPFLACCLARWFIEPNNAFISV